MSIIFQSLGRTVAAGVALLVLILFGAGLGGDLHLIGMRWLHAMAGVMWVGLLWYFNFVQIPSMPKIPDEQKPAIGKVIAPTALFWFRWAALATVVTGLAIAFAAGYLVPALTLTAGVRTIGIGMWLALAMAFNVWFIIWPNQKKALGIVQVEPAEKAAAARFAMLTSRFNTMLSIPMLYCMIAQGNGG
ncbi:MAG: urate hydroxylase PuuD [Betaproteobacteria bacterium]|nr:urate hydroxylase PuuD [Betaproteobacteria bacterium]